MTLVIPLLAIYAETFHATPLQATMLVSVYAACQLVSGPIIGHMSDRVGRKPMLLISQVGTFIGFIVMARAQALWMLYIARVLDGSTAGNLSLAQAYISGSHRAEPACEVVRADWHRIRRRILHRAVVDRLSLREVRIDDAHLPGSGDVGDQRPVHRDAAQRRPPVRARVRRSRGGAALEDLRESISAGPDCASVSCSFSSSSRRFRCSSPALRCLRSAASPTRATRLARARSATCSATSAFSASFCRAG